MECRENFHFVGPIGAAVKAKFTSYRFDFPYRVEGRQFDPTVDVSEAEEVRVYDSSMSRAFAFADSECHSEGGFFRFRLHDSIHRPIGRLSVQSRQTVCVSS